MRPVQRLAFLLFAGAVCIVFVAAWHRLLASPDSWTLYDLGQWLWGGDAVTGIRQYRVGTEAPISHPLFFPALIGGVDRLLGSGFRSGLVVNAMAVLALPWCIYLAVRPLTVTKSTAVTISLATAIGLFANWYFLEEALAGRTMPVAACLMALALHFFFVGARDGRLATVAKLGLTLGVLALTRFDALPFCAVLILGACVILQPTKRHWFALATASSCFLLGLSPYMAYSLQCCGTILATETSGIATLAPPTHPTTYWSVAPPTFLEAPLVWAARLIRSAQDSTRALVMALAVSPLPAILVLFIKPARVPTERPIPFAILILAVLALASLLLGPILLSFPQARYLVVPVALTCVILAARFYSSLFDLSVHPLRRALVMGCAGIVAIVACGYGWSRSPPLLSPSAVSAALGCATHGRLLVAGERGPELAARANILALIEPDNWSDMTAGERNQFLREHAVSAILNAESGRCEPLHKQGADGINPTQKEVGTPRINDNAATEGGGR